MAMGNVDAITREVDRLTKSLQWIVEKHTNRGYARNDGAGTNWWSDQEVIITGVLVGFGEGNP
jgi:hypothetical protein